jgi:cardiolipin-specific phospholipase
MFLFNMAGLSKTHRVILVDWLGTGASDRPAFAPHAKSVAEGEAFFIDSLEEWRASYGITEPFALMGHSLGGYLAAAYALKYPHSLSHLVLASPAGIPDVPPEQRLSARFADSRTLQALEYAWEAGWTPQSLVRGMGTMGASWAGSLISRRFKSMWAARKEAGHTFDEVSFVAYIHAITVPPPSGEDALRVLLAFGAHAREPMGPRLLAAAAGRRAPFDGGRPFPVTLLYGENDWMDTRAGERLATELRRAGADAQCGLIADSGHHLYLENPVAFDRAVVSRLASYNVR